MYRSQFLNHISILFYLIKRVIEPGVLRLSILAGLSMYPQYLNYRFVWPYPSFT